MKQWPKNKHLDNNSEKLDNLEDFSNNKHTIPFDDVEFLKKENQNLEFLLYKYNIILSEYQLKYGNEVFAHLDDLLNKEKQTYLSEDHKNLQFRKQMIENISIIKELEKNNLEMTEKNEFLNSELIRYQKELEDLVKENTELRSELEELKEDHNKLYKSILDSNIKDPNQGNFATGNEKKQAGNNSANLFYNRTQHSNLTANQNLNNNNNNNNNNNMPSSPSQQNFYKTEQFKLNKNLFYTSNHNMNNNNNINENNNNNNNNLNTNNNTGSNFYNSANNFNPNYNSNFNTTNNNTINFLKSQNEELFNLVENMKSEEIQLKAAYTDLRDKYIKTSAESEDLRESLLKYKSECEELLKMKNFVEEKMKENNNQIMINESKLSAVQNECEALKIKNANLRERLQYYQEQYEDLELRKNQEIEAALREAHEAREREATGKAKFSQLEDENQNTKFDLQRFKNENSVLRFDLDHLSKVIEESNASVKSAIEKEKNLDSLQRMAKKKVEEALLDKEKSLTRLKLLERQIVKLTEENSKLLFEKQMQFEEQLENAKANFNQICVLKEDEIANLKADLFAARIERDKYFTEFTILKKEADSFSKVFTDEMHKYVKKYEETEKTRLQSEKELTEKNGELHRKLEQCEFLRNNFAKENEIFRSSESERKNAVEKATRNDEFKSRELAKCKERLEISVKENENMTKEIQRLNVNFTHKLEQLQEKHRLELRILEDSINYQKSQFDAGQAKAFEMVKKQENITEKYKEEYKSTVAYYENMIDNLVRENLSLKKQIGNNEAEEDDKRVSY